MSHSLIAALTREGHWQLTEQDAKHYAIAIKNVARHYSLGVTQKGLDWYALGLCITTMEGSRLVASYRNARSKRSGSPPPQRGPAQVFEFTPRPAPSPANPAGQPASPDAPPSQQQPAEGSVEGFTGDGIDGPIGGNA